MHYHVDLYSLNHIILGFRGYHSSSYSRRGSGGYRGRGGRPNPRSRIDDEGDDLMGSTDDSPSGSR